jgi:hypothetical protein
VVPDTLVVPPVAGVKCHLCRVLPMVPDTLVVPSAVSGVKCHSWRVVTDTHVEPPMVPDTLVVPSVSGGDRHLCRTANGARHFHRAIRVGCEVPLVAGSDRHPCLTANGARHSGRAIRVGCEVPLVASEKCRADLARVWHHARPIFTAR